MNVIPQKVQLVVQDEGICMAMSGKGNIYPVDLNHYCKEINVGDTAFVTKTLDGNWALVDVESKYPKPLDVCEFPRDNNNCLNVVQHCKYLEVIQDMSESERVEYDNHLLRLFIEDYGMKNTLKHRYAQIGYEVSNDMEPTDQPTLEDY